MFAFTRLSFQHVNAIRFPNIFRCYLSLLHCRYNINNFMDNRLICRSPARLDESLAIKFVAVIDITILIRSVNQ